MRTNHHPAPTVDDESVLDDEGQTTAEYALVITAAAVIVGTLITWAQGGSMQGLFDAVINQLTSAVGG